MGHPEKNPLILFRRTYMNNTNHSSRGLQYPSCRFYYPREVPIIRLRILRKKSVEYHKELSDRVVGLALTVFYELGPGLLEDAYEEAMCWELRHANIPHERQMVYPLRYKGDYITSYFADIVVDGKIILELKAVKAPRDAEAEGKKWGLAVTRTRP
jgi:GxxExxY protein